MREHTFEGWPLPGSGPESGGMCGHEDGRIIARCGLEPDAERDRERSVLRLPVAGDIEHVVEPERVAGVEDELPRAR